jgi:CubicO group peptidase (beta-lactamase class C family)
MKRWVRRTLWGTGGLVAVGCAVAAGLYTISWSRLQHVFATTMAGQLCAGIFISGRTPEDIDRQSFVKRPPRDRIYGGLTSVISSDERRVVIDGSLISPIEARFNERTGCTITGSDQAIQPLTAGSVPPAGFDQRYDRLTWLTRPPSVPDIDTTALDAAIEENFADPGHQTHAMLVYQNGVLIREAYANGGGPDFKAESWSLGKTLAGLLAGRLITQGQLSLDEKIQLESWPEKDPRREITVRNLLNMAGGLQFTTEGVFWPMFAQSDHGLIYTNLPDIVAFSSDRPLARPPGTQGDYNNADPTLLLAYIRQKRGLNADGLLQLINDEVLTPLDMRNVRLSTDPKGTPVITGYVYGSARNWAQVGLMLGHDGQWRGKPYVDRSIVRFMSEPSPAYPEQAYGGMVWLNRHKYYNAPRDAIVLSGAGDQIVLILPRQKIVIVRMGHLAKSETMFTTYNSALGRMLAALGVKEEPNN